MPRLLLLLISGVLLFVSSCNVSKNLGEGQSLLIRNKYVLEKTTTVAERDKHRLNLIGITAQKANRRFLGFLPIRMWMYYSAANSKKLTRFKQWIMDKVGEVPVLYDTLLTQKSEKFMENYLFSSGYFYNDVTDTAITKHNRTIVTYKIHFGDPWKIGEINYSLRPFKSDSLLYSSIKNSLLKKDAQFDIVTLKAERERIENLLRNSGFYFFNREYVTYEFDTSKSKVVDIKVVLNQPTDTTQHQQYRLNDFNITTDFIAGANNDTIIRMEEIAGDSNEFHIRYARKILRKKILTDAVYMRRGLLYERDREIKTISRLSLLNTFRFISVDFTKSENREGNYLDCNISLTPAKRQEFQGTGEINVTNEGLFGTAGSFSYKNKNLSKRADQFLFTASTGVQLKFSKKEQVKVITATASSSFTYYLNRFLVPFRSRLFSLNTNPKTRFFAGYNFEHRFDFDTAGSVTFLYQLHNFNLSFGYEWNENRWLKHYLNPISITFYLLPKTGTEFNTRLNANQILKNSYEEQVIIGPNYTLDFNNQRTDNDRIYMRFRTSLETAGNVIYAGFKLANLKNPHDSVYLIAKKPFSQYFRIEGDWRNYFKIRNHGMFAIRTYAGIGVPYGNSVALPFIKQFFVGGPNSLRGFLIREVGPGGYVDTSRYDPETGIKTGTGSFIQTGDIKLELNAELRFDIYRWLKGAIFVDAGNVWTLRKDTRVLGNFSINRFWKEFAIDAGAGVRLDFNFFVVRFDYGFPLRDPRKTDGKRWLFQNAQFRHGQFQLGIGYPF